MVPTDTDRAGWRSAPRLLALAIAAQAAWSLVSWLVVDDQSEGMNSFSTEDFEQWFVATCAGVVVLTSVAALVERRWQAAGLVLAGCVLAVAGWLALFVFFAVYQSN